MNDVAELHAAAIRSLEFDGFVRPRTSVVEATHTVFVNETTAGDA
jgi:hypothetical protein